MQKAAEGCRRPRKVRKAAEGRGMLRKAAEGGGSLRKMQKMQKAGEVCGRHGTPLKTQQMQKMQNVQKAMADDGGRRSPAESSRTQRKMRK